METIDRIKKKKLTNTQVLSDITFLLYKWHMELPS